MPAAAPFAITRAFRLTATLAGLYVADTAGFATRPVERLTLDHDGIPGDRHHGPTRKAGGREPWYPRGLAIANSRHLSILGQPDLDAIAARLDLPAVDPQAIGANLVLAGVTALSFLPRGTRLVAASGAALIITDQNAPCRQSGKALQALHPARPGLDLAFAREAQGLRGVVARIEAAGDLVAGETLILHLPAQWIYPPSGS
jgi:hypothetical protein